MVQIAGQLLRNRDVLIRCLCGKVGMPDMRRNGISDPIDEMLADQRHHGQAHAQRFEGRRRAVERERIERDVDVIVSMQVAASVVVARVQYDPVGIDTLCGERVAPAFGHHRPLKEAEIL